MEKLGGLAHRWRYVVVAVEALVVGGCVYFGLKVVGSTPAQPPVRVFRAPAPPPQAGVGVGLPPVKTATPRKSLPPSHPRVAGLTPDLLSRLNRDDFELYRRQWQVLQMLMDGVRTYLEQRVAPQLLSR